MPHLLDTSCCVEYLRGRNTLLLPRIKARPVSDLFVCSVVKAELFVGALRSARPQANRVQVDAFTRQFVSLPFDDDAADEFGRLRADLEARGQVIGPYDMLIAAIALV